MKSSRSGADLPDLERDLPTTAADVEALRRARAAARLRVSLDDIAELELPRWLEDPAQRKTFEGCEPFEL